MMTQRHILAEMAHNKPSQNYKWLLINFFMGLNNHLKVNPSKNNLLLSTETPINVSVGDVSLTTRTTTTLLENIIDLELPFDQYLCYICSKASKKFPALGLISGYLSF